MAITLQYVPDPRLVGQSAYEAGYGQFAQAQDQFRAGQDQFHLNLGQRAREFDANYGLQAANQAFGQFDANRKFGEGVRQFDANYGLQRDQFGEQQFQADIGNVFKDQALGQEAYQFDVNTDLRYQAMAQEQALQQQKMQQAAAAQEQQFAQQRWQTYAGLEGQRFELHAKQGLAELDKLRETKFRTPELQAQAFAQWNQEYGSYMPAAIDFGPPPEQQDPWDSVPMREFTLPNGQKVTMLARSDGKGNWIPDASMATLEASIWDKQADNERAVQQVELDRVQGEQGLAFDQEKFAQERERAAFDGRVKEYQGRLDGYKAAQDARDSVRAILLKQAEREAGKNEQTELPNPVTPERLQTIEAEVNKIPLPPMPRWEEVVDRDATPVTNLNIPTASNEQEAEQVVAQLRSQGGGRFMLLENGKWVEYEVKP